VYQKESKKPTVFGVLKLLALRVSAVEGISLDYTKEWNQARIASAC
jgi:hypothetical protein